MSDPINSVSSRDVSWPEQPWEREDFREDITESADRAQLGAWNNPPGVIESARHDDRLGVSNACRRAEPGTVDDFLCDDKALEKVQDGALDMAKHAAWKVVELFFGAKGVRK